MVNEVRLSLMIVRHPSVWKPLVAVLQQGNSTGRWPVALAGPYKARGGPDLKPVYLGTINCLLRARYHTTFDNWYWYTGSPVEFHYRARNNS